MSEEHKNCKYRFKGKSCEDCPLGCKFKRLQEENEELKKYQYTQEYLQSEIEKRQKALEEIREILMCKIYGLNENASQLDYMCYTLDKFEKIRIKILTKINEVLNDRD